MTIVVLVPPTSVVTAAEAVDARVFPSTDDPFFIQMLLDAAQSQIDGPKGWLGRSIGIQTLEYRADEFPSYPIILPCPPVLQIDSIGSIDAEGVLQVIDFTAYRQFGSEGERVEAAYGSSWPAPLNQSDAARIQYDAGYEDGMIPPVIKHAIMLMAAGLKDHGIDQGRIRSETVDGVGRFEYQVPSALVAGMRSVSEQLLANYWTPFV